MIHVALGTAYSLGLKEGSSLVPPGTAHLLNSGKCTYDCAYCTRARTSTSHQDYLCRVPWPAFEDEDVFSALRENDERFSRVCIQVVNSKNHLQVASDYVERISDISSLPISVEIRTKRLVDVERFLTLGAEYVGLPLDVASSRLFPYLRGGTLGEDLSFLFEATKEFKDSVGTHLIVGLGETEREMTELLRGIVRNNIPIGLFAFTPCKGTRMEKTQPPSVSQYRRIQITKYLISIGRDGDIMFDDLGKISSFGLEESELRDIPPNIFETQGCEGCNRPYYNERPVGRPYNYPRPLTNEEYQLEMTETSK